jgi:hypothetical protein
VAAALQANAPVSWPAEVAITAIAKQQFIVAIARDDRHGRLERLEDGRESFVRGAAG